MDYKDTLNLPKTDFSMKANLALKEPSIFKRWKDDDLYAAIRKKAKGADKFILHDGPPYANGHIHMGHVLNKILKDIVVKFYTMKGCDSPFIPGWDCHGLPVEHQLFKELGISKYEIDQASFRKKAKEYALKFVKIQREEFERLGVFGRWDRPYLTLDPKYEAAIARSFASLVKEGYIYKDLKPVNWCTTCETALAEAEVEYDEHVSPSIYVKFAVRARKAELRDAYFIIWTTTPWTLLGNVAIAVHPEMDYSILQAGEEQWIMLESLAEATMKKLGKSYKLIEKRKGKDFEGVLAKHPFIDRDSKVVLADYVSPEEGTGCVHTAPGHGQEDYLTGKKYNLPMIMPVDEKGIFDKTAGEFSGLNVHEANPKILARLKSYNSLLLSEDIKHSYPHCWRCKKPIIFRATEQYFASVDHKNLRDMMLDAIKVRIKWHPQIGEGRIYAMVKDRPDWCLSRQRYWGVPIVAFKCKKCGEILLDHEVIGHVAEIFEKESADAWFVKEAKALLPAGAVCKKCKSDSLAKEADILDVWFESGVSHQAVLKNNPELKFPCDLYLEGSDQHRGWFQSALITSCAIEKAPPYKSVLTHGFVVDGEGKKMSKSLGNVISPADVMKRFGADILRLWVASSDYHDDVRLSEEILTRLAEAYRKIRNTFRFLLGNLYDFDPKVNAVGLDKMAEIDRWMLSRLSDVILEAENSYSAYLFHRVFRLVYNFCVDEISSLYLDILKDRLYTFEKDSVERRSCQTVLYEILNALLKLMAPILVFTAEEAWTALRPEKGSIHLENWDWPGEALKRWKNNELSEKWSRLLGIRQEVTKALEEKRITREIGSSLGAKVILHTDKDELKALLEKSIVLLPAFFITSQVELAERDAGNMKKCESRDFSISVKKADGAKCGRCWNYSEAVGRDEDFRDLCARCVEVIRRKEKCRKE